jgi:hypothetical protein
VPSAVDLASPPTLTSKGTTLLRKLPIVLVLIASCAVAQTAKPLPRGFTITSPRLAATVIDGTIVSLKDLRTGEVHADAVTGDLTMPRGLGHMAGNVKAMETLHCPWGNAQMNQGLPPGQAFPTMHFPSPEGRFVATAIKGGMRGTWAGLTNGKEQFPQESLTVECTVDGLGQLLIRATAQSDTGGVYGVQAPVANLHPDHRFYVASFGGVMYDRTNRPGLITLGGAPFWEAAVIAAEGKQGSLCLWAEDPTFRPNFCFLNWSGKSFSAALEALNLIPYEQHQQVASVTWHLDVFSGGWVDAMTPYKQWYARAFAPEMKTRAATRWADKIRVIVDHVAGGEETYRALAATFDPETVLLHNWNARAPEFDHDLPDWTPRAGYVDSVKLAHQHGFHQMAYVNTYCVNYGSPVFVRDKVQSFGLLRGYGGVSRYPEKPTTWADIKDGQLLYLDPLSPAWRQYHTDMMLTWRQETGTDANYEDTAGAIGDYGNGVIDGKSGTQGATEQFRELLRRNPEVPMAAEYAPEPIAFAIRWPLRYQQVWGNEATRVWWMEHQRPVSAYIHGPLARAWVPVINAESDFAKHVVVACSDALGGMAQIAGVRSALEATSGMNYHMRTRAQLFAHRQLTPVFPRERWDDGLACLYEDREGRRYRYTVSPTVQQMSGPDGQPLYQRVTGLNQFATPLTLPGWPAAAEGKLLGLNPDIRYALCQGGHDRTKVQVLGLPDGIRIKRYEGNALRTVVALEPIGDSSPKAGKITLQTNAKFSALLINDKPAALPAVPDKATRSEPADYDVTFPAYLTFFEKGAPKVKVGELLGDGLEKGRFIAMASGLERGDEYVVPFRPECTIPGAGKQVFMFINGGAECEVVLDYLALVPDAQTSVQVYVRNNQVKYGNGGIARLYVNGHEVHGADLGPRPNPDWKAGMDPYQKNVWDTDIHGWRVPLGHLAGQPVALTIASDAKGSNNADQIWWTRPWLAQDAAQRPVFVRMTDAGPVAE